MSDGRGVLVSGNWKMNETHLEALRFVAELEALLLQAPLPETTEVSLHPSFTSIRTVQSALERDRVPVALGAQNCHFEDAGAYTGEVSAPMLAKLGVRYVICGHSERRRLFGETDEIVGRKLDAVLRHGMSPILCVGEDGAEREAGEAHAVVTRQLESAFSGGRRGLASRFVVAYEPVWAIGTGAVATPEDAEEMAAHIHAELGRLCGAGASGVRVQYGGSVSEESAAGLLREPSVDGLLVGGASLDPARFVKICRAA